MDKTIIQISISRLIHSACKSVFLCFIGLVCSFQPQSTYATPIIEIDCRILRFSKPYPDDMDPSRLTIRRHWIPTEPYNELSNDLWSFAEFQSGTFEVDWWMIDGTKYTDKGDDLYLSIQDGRNGFDDKFVDQARQALNPVVVQDHRLESFGFSLVSADGEAIHDHLNYPDIDLNNWDNGIRNDYSIIDQHCWVNFRDLLNRYTSCNINNPITDQCNIGENRGNIKSITLLPHEADHAGSFVINAGLNDAWVSADAPLQGFFFTVFPDLKVFFLSWFTFDSTPPANGTPAVFGAADQRWVTGAGAYSGNSVTINVELTSGGIFNASDPLATQQPGFGTITIVFNSCNEALLTYDFPAVGLSGEMTLTRVVPDNVALCEALAAQ